METSSARPYIQVRIWRVLGAGLRSICSVHSSQSFYRYGPQSPGQPRPEAAQSCPEPSERSLPCSAPPCWIASLLHPWTQTWCSNQKANKTVNTPKTFHDRRFILGESWWDEPVGMLTFLSCDPRFGYHVDEVISIFFACQILRWYGYSTHYVTC